jgi:hypothetical protein
MNTGKKTILPPPGTISNPKNATNDTLARYLLESLITASATATHRIGLFILTMGDASSMRNLYEDICENNYGVSYKIIDKIRKGISVIKFKNTYILAYNFDVYGSVV